MTVLANFEIIWVFIIISVIVQVIKGVKKVASQTPGKTTGADEGASSGSKPREFVAPDEALQEFLRTLGSGQKPADKPTAPSPVQAISVTRGISRPQVEPKKRTRPPAIRPAIPAAPRHEPAETAPAYAQSVQDAVVLEKTSSGKQTAASILGLAIRKDLSDAEAIRKAIVLREVLGPPIALRG